jgi:hypothetical protein
MCIDSHEAYSRIRKSSKVRLKLQSEMDRQIPLSGSIEELEQWAAGPALENVNISKDATI